MVDVTLPNVKQKVVNPDGQCSKAWFDFFRLLFERTGGDTDNVADSEDNLNGIESQTYARRDDDLRKRVEDLEKRLDALGCL